MTDITKVFGSKVFNDKVMKEKLSAATYEKLLNTIKRGTTISSDIAGEIAEAMKSWAIENGATHFTHWFHPLSGATAEKHESFIATAGGGKIRLEFSPGNLVKGEADASSFPSGAGSFNGTEIEATGDAYIEGSTGSTKATTIKCQHLTVKHSIGGATLEDVQCQDLTVKASTGAVRLTNAIVDNKMDIIFNDSDAASLKIETDTGDVKGNFLSPKIVYFDSDTGHGNYPKETSGGICDIKTDTGNANLTW